MLHQNRFLYFLSAPPVGWTGVITVLILSVIGNKLTELIPGSSGWQQAASVLFLVLFLWACFAIWRKSKPRVFVPQSQQPQKHHGLILLVGSGRPKEDPMDQSAWAAITYHMPAGGREGLRICWMIATAGTEGSLPVAQKLSEMCAEKNIRASIQIVKDAFDTQETYQVVQNIYAEELPKEGLSEDEVIADFTGGVKPMSAGVILACGERRKMQYMYGRKEGVASVPRLVEFTP